METEAYQKSVLEYDDIAEALKYERLISKAEGIAEGITQGMARSIAKSIEEGIAKGIEEGRARMAAKIILNAKNKGFSVEDIADLTNFRVEVVEIILEKHNKR
jgi:flagellar biosynthesis/type III secretory pathway protein FliH